LFILLQGIITIIIIAITIVYVSPTTTATGGMPFSACPSPNQRGATPHHNCNPAAAGQHHAPSAIGE